ncbi:ATP-binding protein [Nocardioides massiliensis]|uniref:Propionyl-CoA carboxylase alpha chain n=1 Tax=Nocardioides massiliensis TaxID=1325935 RepID=A0ABT9NMJ9_9ACTN|nr:biotin carboxylase N-terminal domain-containing protein [Nocardioides massiliensis]MDP9821429.1 propionyl-CoA carboxylase alpha chain [Nocardioides massiliensis]
MIKRATISTLLVANRGEIASRVFATCRRLGIRTVAVHSDADAGLPFVAEADLAVRLPGNSPAETYLRADLVLDAARRTGADAIHPGYGFLSENADFARAVIDAGLTWVGPAPASIEQMGSKIAAKQLMNAAGVPCLDDLDPSALSDADLPVLVKTSAGGGGRGMRVVRDLESLSTAVDSARDEAASAFGDGAVFVEPYVERGRHVEVQVVGTADGVLVLGDRDCSLQRRHQKVVEEAPAPGIRDEVRTALHEAARAAAAAIDYRGAGTVEFLYDAATERFYFLEMNTRLQVEHPVTEAVFGIDLVEAQLAVAEGRPVVARASSSVEPVETNGHAVEVRLYAEDPAHDYQPQSGRLDTFEVPDVDVRFGPLAAPGLRLDAGFGSGDEVGTHYDAMLAKLISWAPTREQAVRRLHGALRRARIHGVVTNRDQLLAVLEDDRFLAGEVSTAFLAEPAAARSQPPYAAALAAYAVAVTRTELQAARRCTQPRIPAGWRNVLSAPHRLVLDAGEVTWHGPGAGRPAYTLLSVAIEGSEDPGVVEVLTARVEAATATVALVHDGITHTYVVAESLAPDGDGARYDVDGPHGHHAFVVGPRFTDPADQVAAGSLLAPMPGSVVRVAVEAGQEVRAGDPVLVLEAMKMQHTVSAPTDGVVSQLPVSAGQQVAAGDVLAVVEAVEVDPTHEEPA